MESYLKEPLSHKNIKRGNFVDNESYVNICESFITWYEKREEVFIRNTMEVYKLTNFETGYSALSKDWLKWKHLLKDSGKQYTLEFIKKTMKDKITAPMAHLYQALDWKTEQQFNFIGLFIVGFINVRVEESEIRDKKKVVASYGVQLNIGDSDQISFLADE
jgi:hypothetical protein